MSRWIVRRAVEGDWPALVLVEAACFGDDGYSRYFLRMAPLIDAVTVWVAEDDSAVVGYVLGAFENPERAWLMSVAVTPDACGQGIGTSLCKRLLQDAAGRGGKEVFLTVHPTSPAARLYRRLGFTDVAVDDSFYGDGQPRLVMACDLLATPR